MYLRPAIATAGLLAILCEGCAKHPVEVLRRQAAKEERALSRHESDVFSDARYFVPLPDAAAASVEVLEGRGKVIDVSKNSVGTDWSYSGSVEIEEAGEAYQERRERDVVSLNTIGAEVEVAAVAVTEQRKLRANGAPGRWLAGSRAADLPQLETRLQSLERAHLSAAVGNGSTQKILGALAGSMPNGFALETREGSTVTLVRTRSARKEWEKRGKWATWDAKESLAATVDADSKAVSYRYRLENRFSTEESEGVWEHSATVDAALPIDWLAAAIRAGAGKGNIRLGSAQMGEVTARHDAPAEPPPHPRLRTMAEIETIIRRRAYESHVGNFTVCLNYVVINPTSPNGYDWDLPGVSNALAATEVVSSAAAQGLGEINEVADSHPVIGMIADAGIDYVTGGLVDRKQAESITRTTGKVAGWTSRHLPVKPDVAGLVSVAGNQFTLPEQNDSLKLRPDVCATADFEPRSAAAAIQLWDVDLTENDPIGQCAIRFGTVVDRGISGIPCGYARAYMSARYNFSFGQIQVVGLPPSE